MNKNELLKRLKSRNETELSQSDQEMIIDLENNGGSKKFDKYQKMSDDYIELLKKLIDNNVVIGQILQIDTSY